MIGASVEGAWQQEGEEVGTALLAVLELCCKNGKEAYLCQPLPKRWAPWLDGSLLTAMAAHAAPAPIVLLST